MANYYAAARSNYFKVKDVEAFKLDMPGSIGVWEMGDNVVGVYEDAGDGGGWPTFGYEDETDEEREFWVPELISKHLVDGEVAIFMEAGAEKLRYVHGHATAINSKGEYREIGLHDIYKLAEELGENITPAEY